MKKILFYVTLVLFISLQLIPTSRPENRDENINDLIINNQIKPEVKVILKNSCYDCHSFETNYPWYSMVAPTKWLVYRDTKVGREALNFSDWEAYSKLEKIKLLGQISEEIENDEMPMKIYTSIHGDATLSIDDKSNLVTWIEDYGESLFN